MPSDFKVLSGNGSRGEVDMVVERIVGVAGVDVVGLIPAELQTPIGFAAGASRAATEPEVARSFIRFLTAPAAAPVLKSMGIEPFVE